MARILIVDDSAVSRKLLRRMIDLTEHEVVAEAESGEKAILEVRKVNPDIIMMDLDMPGIGGLAASIKIKAHYPSIKIIIVSAHEQSSITNEFKQNGLNYFISKPINNEKVVKALQGVLSEPENNNGDITSENCFTEKVIFEKDLFEDLDIKVGDKVAISYFSSLQDLKAQILTKMKNELTIKFIKDYSISNFSVNEPITVSFASNNENYICEADIISINSNEKNITLHITKLDNLNDEQLLELFPTSLAINIKEEFQTKNLAATIKNIGVYELKIKAGFELSEASKVILDMYLDGKAFNISAETTDKVKINNTYEYKVKVTFIDLNSKRFLISYIHKLKKQRIDSIFILEKD